MKQGNISHQELNEKEEIILDLRAEIQLLKDAHQNLIHKTFDAERERTFRAKEREYQVRAITFPINTFNKCFLFPRHQQAPNFKFKLPDQ